MVNFLSCIIWIFVLYIASSPSVGRQPENNDYHFDQISKSNLVHSLSKGILKFSFDIYKTLNKRNACISPLGVSLALSMILNGAAKSTLVEMKYVMYLHELSTKANINKAFQTVLNSMAMIFGDTLFMVNLLLVDKKFQINERFYLILNDSYKSEVTFADFHTNSTQVAHEINIWVQERSHNRITQIPPANFLTQSSKLVSINVMDFRGTWKLKFESIKTDTFNLANGDEVKVTMMNLQSTFNYTFSKEMDCKLLQLDFSNDRLVMYFLLPIKSNGLNRLKEEMSAEVFTSMRQKLIPTDVRISIPKFDIRSSEDLSHTLFNMELDTLFGSGAQLFGIATAKDNERLRVTNVIHQACVSVNENGSKKAEEGLIRSMFFSINPFTPKTKDFKADQPFIFIIYDRITDLILYIGNVENPTLNSIET